MGGKGGFDCDIGEQLIDECLLADLACLRTEASSVSAEMGTRPYRLFSVTTEWSGGAKGRGDERVVGEVEILPRPRVSLATVRDTALAGGEVERGMVKVSDISLSYTEEDLMHFFHLAPLPSNQQGFLEVQIDPAYGGGERRRYSIDGPPWLDGDKQSWQIILSAQDSSRTNTGELAKPDIRRDFDREVRIR